MHGLSERAIELEVDLPCVTNHAQMRAHERCVLPPTRLEWVNCVMDIMDRRGVLLRSEHVGNRNRMREHWIVYLGDERIIAVWAPYLSLLVTVLREDSWGAQNWIRARAWEQT